jgi:hypothetical protein
MERSRADRVLEEWDVISRTARRPQSAGPDPRRDSLPIGVLVLAAIAVLVVAVILPGMQGPGPTASVPAVGASATTSSSPTATTNPSPSDSPVKTPSSSASLTSADGQSVVRKYLDALVAGDAGTAWALLGPTSRAGYASKADFASERAAYLHGVGTAYTLVANPPNAPSLAKLAAPIADDHPDLSQAVIVEVDHPAYTNQGNNAAWELYLVAPRGGTPTLWSVR